MPRKTDRLLDKIESDSVRYDRLYAARDTFMYLFWGGLIAGSIVICMWVGFTLDRMSKDNWTRIEKQCAKKDGFLIAFHANGMWLCIKDGNIISGGET